MSEQAAALAICEIRPRVICDFGAEWHKAPFFDGVENFDEILIGFPRLGNPSQLTAEELPEHAKLLRTVAERNLFLAHQDSYSVFGLLEADDHLDKNYVVLELRMESPRMRLE